MPSVVPTWMWSPGFTIFMSVTCSPPMKFFIVSCRPSEIAMPPTPMAATRPFTSTPKQADSTVERPITQIAARAMFTRMLHEGRGTPSERRILRMSLVARLESTTVTATITTATTIV